VSGGVALLVVGLALLVRKMVYPFRTSPSGRHHLEGATHKSMERLHQPVRPGHWPHRPQGEQRSGTRGASHAGLCHRCPAPRTPSTSTPPMPPSAPNRPGEGVVSRCRCLLASLLASAGRRTSTPTRHAHRCARNALGRAPDVFFAQTVIIPTRSPEVAIEVVAEVPAEVVEIAREPTDLLLQVVTFLIRTPCRPRRSLTMVLTRDTRLSQPWRAWRSWRFNPWRPRWPGVEAGS
jgi:hypothetical protein